MAVIDTPLSTWQFCLLLSDGETYSVHVPSAIGCARQSTYFAHMLYGASIEISSSLAMEKLCINRAYQRLKIFHLSAENRLQSWSPLVEGDEQPWPHQ